MRKFLSFRGPETNIALLSVFVSESSFKDNRDINIPFPNSEKTHPLYSHLYVDEITYTPNEILTHGTEINLENSRFLSFIHEYGIKINFLKFTQMSGDYIFAEFLEIGKVKSGDINAAYLKTADIHDKIYSLDTNYIYSTFKRFQTISEKLSPDLSKIYGYENYLYEDLNIQMKVTDYPSVKKYLTLY